MQPLRLKRNIFIFVLLLSFQHTFSQVKNDTFQIDAKNKVFTKVEIDASFSGGDRAWNKYISDAFKNADFSKFKNADQGTCRVQFIVDKRGNISSVEALNMKKTRLAKLAIEIISNSPRWNPAQQDGRFVNAYRVQPLTFAFNK